MAETVRQYEETYFRKRGVQNQQAREYDYFESVPLPSVPSSDSVSIPSVQTKSNFLTRFEIIFLSFSVMVAMIFVGMNLWVQSYNSGLDNTANNYRTQTAELKRKTDLMINDISEQYNYSSIKKAAENQSMQINKDQVKDVTE